MSVCMRHFACQINICKLTPTIYQILCLNPVAIFVFNDLD